MSDLRKAAQQALEALEAYDKRGTAATFWDTITALRAALAQPEPEPVRRVQKQFMDEEVFYTAPPQRKPLTEEEIAIAANSIRWSEQYHVDFARAIERAHGID